MVNFALFRDSLRVGRATDYDGYLDSILPSLPPPPLIAMGGGWQSPLSVTGIPCQGGIRHGRAENHGESPTNSAEDPDLRSVQSSWTRSLERGS